jgi:hypothetical protein
LAAAFTVSKAYVVFPDFIAPYNSPGILREQPTSGPVFKAGPPHDEEIGSGDFMENIYPTICFLEICASNKQSWISFYFTTYFSFGETR